MTGTKIFTEEQLNGNEPLYEDYPYEVRLGNKDGQATYVVVNVETGVEEVVETVLGKALTYADHSSGFIKMFFEQEEDDGPQLEVFPAGAIPKH